MKFTDEQLIEKTLSGDKNAYEKLVQKYQDMVYGLAFHFTKNFADAQDIAQEAFIKGYLNLASLKQKNKFAGWMRTITANLCKSMLSGRNADFMLFSEQKPSPAGGGWLQLNGIDSFAVCPDNDSLDKNLKDFTIEAWIYPKRKPERDEWWIIVAKPGSYELAFVGPTEEFVRPITDFGIVFTVYKNENSYGLIHAQKGQMRGPPWFPDDFKFNEWHHITARFAKIDWGLYIDGKAVRFGGPRDFPLANTHSAFYAGGIKNHKGHTFDGCIDELRISNIARPIKADNKFGRFNVDRATQALWHFDEPESAISFQDSSGNSNTLIGKGSAFPVEPAGKLTTTLAKIKSKH